MGTVWARARIGWLWYVRGIDIRAELARPGSTGHSTHISDFFEKNNVDAIHRALEEVPPRLRQEEPCTYFELGFGTGIGLQKALEHLSPTRMVGFDLSEDMLVRARARLGLEEEEEEDEKAAAGVDIDIDLRVVDCDDGIPLEDASVDVVFSSHVVYFLRDPRAMFAEFRRILRPGGHIVTVMTERLPPPPLDGSVDPFRNRYLAVDVRDELYRDGGAADSFFEGECAIVDVGNRRKAIIGQRTKP